MSGQIKALVTRLRAVGSRLLADGSLCLLSQDGESLVEKIYDDDYLQDQRLVADNVRAGVSASYIAGNEKSFILFTDANGELRGSEFDEDAEEWVEAPLEGLESLSLHPKSHVRAVLVPGGALVFFQSANDEVTSIRFNGTTNSWSSGFNVPGKAQPGTPLSAFITSEALAISFLDPQGHTHCHVREFKTGDWKDNEIPNSRFSEPVSSIAVIQDAESATFEIYALTRNSVEYIGKEGSRSTVGAIANDDFVPTSKAECGSALSIYHYGDTIIYGGGRGGRRGGGGGGWGPAGGGGSGGGGSGWRGGGGGWGVGWGGGGGGWAWGGGGGGGGGGGAGGWGGGGGWSDPFWPPRW